MQAPPTLSPSAHKHTRQPHHMPHFFLSFLFHCTKHSVAFVSHTHTPSHRTHHFALPNPKPNLLFLFLQRFLSFFSFHLFFVSYIHSFSRPRHTFELSSMADGVRATYLCFHQRLAACKHTYKCTKCSLLWQQRSSVSFGRVFEHVDFHNVRIRYETKVRVNVPSSCTAAGVESRVCGYRIFRVSCFYLLFEMFSLDSGSQFFPCTRAFVCLSCKTYLYSFIPARRWNR